MTADPIICVHRGRSTWQGPASAAPRKEGRMAYDLDEAERAAQVMDSTSDSLRRSSRRANDAAALIRAQAAEIERLLAGNERLRDSFDSLEARLHDAGFEAIFDHEGLARATRAIDAPAPQPDADEREAMVGVLKDALWTPCAAEAEDVADALLAAGWTRKREDE